MIKSSADLQKCIQAHLGSDFEKSLFEASLDFLDQNKSALKYNAFAFSLRELFRHIMERLAPDDSVKACSWFKQDSNIEAGRLTRFQRFKYTIQRGLEDKFSAEELGIDPADCWSEVKAAIDSLSKLTHVGPKTFGLNDEEGDKLVFEALNAIWTILASVEDARTALEAELHRYIDQAVTDASIRETNTQIDLLSSNSIVEGVSVENWEITSLDSLSIHFQGNGTATVTLGWGRGDDHADLTEDFPFSFIGTSPTNSPRAPRIEPQKINIDTSEWFG